MAFAKVKPVPIESQSNAVVYARYSSNQQTENSIDGQLRECGKYAEMHGYNIIGTYIDRAISGTTDNRPDFQRMIEDAKKQTFAFIIVYRFDRFARNRFDSAIYKKQLGQVGVRVISTSESVGEGDEGIILESIYEAMDEAYSRRLSTITVRGMKEAAMKGKWMGANVPLGYTVVDGFLQIDPRGADIVRQIFHMYADGKTKTQIVNAMNEKGYRTSLNKPFQKTSIDGILKNKKYSGVDMFMDIERECPKIIEKELFDKVQDLMKANARHYGRKVEQNYYALSGKLYCGLCGFLMTGDAGTSRNGERHTYYTCHNRKKYKNCQKKSERQDFLEWYICEQTVKYILTPMKIEAIAEKIEQMAKEDIDNNGLSEAEKRKAQIDRELDKCVDSLMNTQNTAVIKKINEKADALQKELSDVETTIAKIKLRADCIVKKENVVKYLESFKGGDLFDVDFRQRLINTLIQSIYLFDDKIVIYFNVTGAKQVSYIDAIRSLEELKCSDSDVLGEGKFKLSEHILFVFCNNTFGCVIKIER